MHNPPHPGEVLRELCLDPIGLTVTAASEALGVGRKTLSAVLNGKAGISPEMVHFLSAYQISHLTNKEIYQNGHPTDIQHH